uniref:Uncharacterized protein n=1 Tax=Salix viminalis TaxID=40686 RepID=A0A6N2JZF7_SALVM
MAEMQLLIDDSEELQSKLGTSMQDIRWNKRSIYKLPASVTVLNRTAYRPQTVSFGPYHHYDDQLKRMEEHKHRALYYFLRRSGKSLELFLQSLTEVVQDLRDSYDQLDKSWEDGTNKFLQLMILDGCFMLEIMHLATAQSYETYAADDPVFSSHGKVYMVPFIRRDMLIVENQLPMLVLYKLAANIESDGRENEESVSRLILNFCCPDQASVSVPGKCLHVLDLYRKSLIQEDPNRKGHQTIVRGGLHKDVNDTVRSAAEINEAGIRFKKSKTKSLKDISLHHGVLHLPAVVVDDVTEAVLLNLMAFERFHPGAGNELLGLNTKYMIRRIYDDTEMRAPCMTSLICVKKTTIEQLEAMEEEKQVLIEVVSEKLQNMANTSMKNVLWSKRSIYKIPAPVTALNETAYMPQTVSFGPYHHDGIHLKPMEEHKKRALGYFLNSTGKSLPSIVGSLNEEIQVLKDSYDMLGESWKNDKSKFLQLMILDGCFMLEIIRPGTRPLDDSADDPIFSSHGSLCMIPYIRRDLLLLENQLPMLVLYKLVGVDSDGAKDVESVNKLVHNFFYPNASVSNLGKCLHNAIGSDKAVAKLFNSLSTDIAMEPNRNLQVVQMHVHAYCKKPWNAWRANLIHIYFRNPWAILSVIAALILFALTIVQTVYSVLSYSPNDCE